MSIAEENEKAIRSLMEVQLQMMTLVSSAFDSSKELEKKQHELDARLVAIEERLAQFDEAKAMAETAAETMAKLESQNTSELLAQVENGRLINTRVTLEAWKMARELRLKGLSVSAVARTLNRPRSTVQYLLERSEESIKRSIQGKRRRKKPEPVMVKEDNEEILAAFRAARIDSPEEVEEKNLALDFPDYVC